MPQTLQCSRRRRTLTHRERRVGRAESRDRKQFRASVCRHRRCLSFYRSAMERSCLVDRPMDPPTSPNIEQQTRANHQCHPEDHAPGRSGPCQRTVGAVVGVQSLDQAPGAGECARSTTRARGGGLVGEVMTSLSPRASRNNQPLPPISLG